MKRVRCVVGRTGSGPAGSGSVGGRRRYCTEERKPRWRGGRRGAAGRRRCCWRGHARERTHPGDGAACAPAHSHGAPLRRGRRAARRGVSARAAAAAARTPDGPNERAAQARSGGYCDEVARLARTEWAYPLPPARPRRARQRSGAAPRRPAAQPRKNGAAVPRRHRRRRRAPSPPPCAAPLRRQRSGGAPAAVCGRFPYRSRARWHTGDEAGGVRVGNARRALFRSLVPFSYR
jgi:hypothetical protein